jgi:polyphosphate kinase
VDSDKFIKFREESQILISSSDWLTRQMNELIEEATNLPEDVDPDVCEDISTKMDALLLKANWEDRAYSKFRKKYEDITNDK